VGIMTELERLFQEYMATPDDGVEVDAPPMQLRPELQPCTHPVQAIRSSKYIGDQHSNYCGWCAEVAKFEREHELCQTLTAELLEYRGQVARLRKALAAVEWVADGIGWEYCAWCHGYSQLHLLDCQRQAALSTPADDQAPTT